MKNIEIRDLHESEVEAIVNDFHHAGINRDKEYFRFCLDEMKAGNRVTFVARVNNHFVGTGHFLFESHYPHFKDANIPEINDVVVIPCWRKKGIGDKLMEALETYAISKDYNRIGLGVGLYKDYSSAQRLYINRGYVPDNHGVFYEYEELEPGKMVRLDDELNLCFTKKLTPTK